MYRRYARELKDQACALVIHEQYDPANAGKQLGIPEMTLRGWLTKRNWKGIRAMPDTDDPKILKGRIRELEAKLRRAKMEREILKSDGVLRQPPSARFDWIHVHRGELQVNVMCHILDVT